MTRYFISVHVITLAVPRSVSSPLSDFY